MRKGRFIVTAFATVPKHVVGFCFSMVPARWRCLTVTIEDQTAALLALYDAMRKRVIAPFLQPLAFKLLKLVGMSGVLREIGLFIRVFRQIKQQRRIVS